MTSGLSLYKLTAAQDQFLHMGIVVDEETGEIIFEEPEDFVLALSEKAEAVACYRKSLVATAEALKHEIDELTKRRAIADKAVERFDDYILRCLEQTDDGKLETSKCKLSTRKSKAVSIVDVDALPDCFWSEKVTRTPNKKAIKSAISDGADVPGACIVENLNLQVK